MTQPQLPNPDREPESDNNPTQPQRRRKRRRWLWAGLSVLAVTGGGLTAGWFILKHQLAPILSRVLTDAIERPLNLGEVDRLSLTGVRFGKTEIPATPDDPDWATVEAVEVTFNPLRVLTDKTLELHVTLIEPNAYIEEDVNGEWIKTRLKEPEEESDWTIDVQSIRAKDAEVTAVKRGIEGKLKAPVEIEVPQATVRTYDDYELLEAEAKGAFKGGGTFDLAGSVRPETLEAKVNLKTEKLSLPYLSRAVNIPINVRAGTVGTNLEIALDGDPRKVLPRINGLATLQNISAKIDEPALGLDEPAQKRAVQKRQQQPQDIGERSPFYFLNNLPIAIPPIDKTNGRLAFQGTKVRVENFTTQLGEITAAAKGSIDLKSGYNLAVTTKPLEIAQLLKTFELPKPAVPVAGEFKVGLNITGPLDKPAIASNLIATKPIRLDRVTLSQAQAKLAFSLANLTLILQDFQATPTLGGKVTGKGVVRFASGNDKGNIALNFQTQNIPGDAIAALYTKNLPITIGPVSLQGRVFGPMTKIEDLQAQFFGNLLGGGTITAREVKLKDGRFSGTVLASGLAGTRFLPATSPLRSEVGEARALLDISGRVNRFSFDTLTVNGYAAVNVAGGTLTANNLKLSNGRFVTELLASGVQTGRIAPKLVPASLSLPPLGSLNGRFDLAGRLGGNTAGLPVQGLQGTGSLTVGVAGGTAEARGIELSGDRWQAKVALNQIQPAPFTASLNLPPALTRLQRTLGEVSGNFNVAGRLNSFDPNTLTATGTSRVAVAGGTANVALDLDRGNWEADIDTQGVQLTRLTAGLSLPRAIAQAQRTLGAFTGNIRAAGNLRSLNPQTLTARGRGRVTVAGGTANVALDLNRGNWEADIAASGILPQRLFARVPPPFQRPVSGTANLRGTLTDLSLEAIAARGSGSLNLAGGTLAANNLRLNNGNLQATLIPNNIEIGRLVEGANGRIGGNIDVTANLANLTPAGIRARGRINTSEGLLPIEGPLAATFNWNGDRLQIEKATAEGLDASGFIDIDTLALGRGQIGPDLVEAFNLNVGLRGLNLQQLSEQAKSLIAWPENVAAFVNQTEVLGLADFDGNLSGTLKTPQLNGNLALRNAQLNDLALDPVVSGPVNFTPGQGVSLRLAGTDDKLELVLSPDYKPDSFLVQVDELFATGTRQGELLAVNVRNFPLAYAKRTVPPQLLPPEIASQPLSGSLSGDFNVNLNTLAASGRIEVEDPLLSRLSGDRFSASFQYANGSGVINDAVFQQGDTKYALEGRVIQTARGPEFNAELLVEDGNIQDILTTVQIFDIADFTQLLILPSYGRSADVDNVAAIDIAQLPLLAQLRRFSEIEALIEERRRERAAASPLPPLAEALGSVAGKINVSGSLRGIDITFDFNGADWLWGPFEADRMVAQGSFQNGVLSVRPFQLDLQDGGSIHFAGSIGGDTQSGQLRVEQVPVALIQEFVPLPLDIGFEGFVNATAVLGGSKKNPQARGQLTVVDATLNNETVEATQGNFSYNQGILNFSANSIIEAGTEPLTISGTFPYKFPFRESVEPSSDRFELNLNLKNNGLTILNALTRQQLIWKEGEGLVNLLIAGRYDRENNRLLDLQAEGIVDLKDAAVASLLLADTLTDIDGNIEFNFDRLTVNNLNGQFGGGNVSAVGSLPLTHAAAVENPLQITLNELAVNLKGLYTGDVGGNLIVTGAALQPNASGELQLSNGRVLLAGLVTLRRGRFVGGSGGGTGEGGAARNIVTGTELNNVELVLAEDLRLEQPFLLNFGAEGTILLNGPIGAIAPQGIVRLTNGQINLFTTQLRLRGGYDNIAIFQPEYGLNPRLDLRLVGSVVESSRTITSNDPFSTEISESLINRGSIETIRVEAIVDGFALDLLESLKVEPGVASVQRVKSVIELTSTPPRSETQIIALLGGSFINAFSQQDSGLGLANLASNALFGSIQNALANSLGLSEFRIFPSAVPNTDDRTSSFGIAAELGYNITDDLGVSVTQFLTPQVPTQLNVRYRLNDYFLLRGATNFSDENRVQIEYRQRF